MKAEGKRSGAAVRDLEARLPRVAELAVSAGAFTPKSRNEGGRVLAASDGDEEVQEWETKYESEVRDGVERFN